MNCNLILIHSGCNRSDFFDPYENNLRLVLRFTIVAFFTDKHLFIFNFWFIIPRVMCQSNTSGYLMLINNYLWNNLFVHLMKKIVSMSRATHRNTFFRALVVTVDMSNSFVSYYVHIKYFL